MSLDTPVNIVTVEWTLNALSRRRPHARAERSLSLCRSLFILRKVPWPNPLLHIQTLPLRHTTHLHLTSLPSHIHTDMAADLQAIAGQLQASLDPQQSRQGESSPHRAPIHHLHQS